jgi:hypothetical protein
LVSRFGILSERLMVLVGIVVFAKKTIVAVGAG